MASAITHTDGESRICQVPQAGIGDGETALRAAVATGKPVDVIGASGGSLALALTRLLNPERPMVVLAADFGQASAIAADLAFFSERESDVLLFPEYDIGPCDEMVPDRRAVMARASVLFRLQSDIPWRFLVLCAASAMRRVVPRQQFGAHCHLVRTGETVVRDRLISTLRLTGYREVRTVEEPGTWNVRGSLLDVFVPDMEFPVRMDFDGDVVNGQWTFSPDSQTRISSVLQVALYPSDIAILPDSARDRSAIADRIRELCDQVNFPTGRTELLMEDILSGRSFVGAHVWQSIFWNDDVRETVLDYVAHGDICVHDPQGIQMIWERRYRAFCDDLTSRITAGVPTPSIEALVVEPVQLEKQYVTDSAIRFHCHELSSGTDDDGCDHSSAVVRMCAQEFSGLRRKLDVDASVRGIEPMDAFCDLLRTLAEQGYRTLIVGHTAGQVFRLSQILEHRDMTVVAGSRAIPAHRGLHICEGQLRRGFLWPGEGLCCIAEEEIFGRRQRARGLRTHPRSALFDLKTLHPEELVIHREHGIGRYKGLVRREIHGTPMDFLCIAYRGDDRLYLPVYRISQIQKYAGASNAEPPLDRLGGQTFSRSRNAAREEALALSGELLRLYARKELARREPLVPADDLFREFEAAFPFEETPDQAAVIDDIMRDLERPVPMDRLVCGDVGFGKTEVALRAAFRVVASGRQVAILVPTTILAQQHYQSLCNRFSPYPVRVEMLSRFRNDAQNTQTAAALKEGRVDIVVGTHRLLQADIHFRRLGLLVIDEEHRFGVSHKERIRSLKASVDMLSMTATPIPRTLYMAFSRLRDLSLISTAPVDRLPVRTMICHDTAGVIESAIARELSRDGQVFFVHNRVRDIARIADRIRRTVPNARVAVGHGKMKESKLEEVMSDFVAGHFDVLVCTAIIESGLDIPRANTIIVDRADTFGLAQLYQLRGRVGRSSRQAYAYLVVPPLAWLTPESRDRLDAMVRHTDLGSGFSVAAMDLEIRGAGNLLGAEQSGAISGVGYEMFMEMIEEATARLKGESRIVDREPEITLETPGFLPEDYIPDPGLRLHYYKELAMARCEEELQETVRVLVDRFGACPQPVMDLLDGMAIKVLCRQLDIAGIETTRRRIILHLGPGTQVDPEQVATVIREGNGLVRLTPDYRLMKLLEGEDATPTRIAIQLLRSFCPCAIKNPVLGSIS